MNKKLGKILVIEDDTMVRENIQELLELSQYEVEVAENGKVGVIKAEEFSPELIICDVMMPELDGYGVLHILRKRERFLYIPFLFLSAKSEKRDRRKGMGLGADDYITKPYDDIEFLNTVELRLKKYKDFVSLNSKVSGAVNLDDLLAKGIERTFEQGQSIYLTNENPMYVYYVQTGLINITSSTEDGKELILDQIHESSFFGYSAIFSKIKYDNSAIAAENSLLVRIDKYDFLEFVSKNPGLGFDLLKTVNERLHLYQIKMLDFAYASAKKRIVTTLWDLFHSSDCKTINTSRVELSHMAGTTPETVARTISELKSSEVIAANGLELVLINEIKYKDLMNWY